MRFFGNPDKSAQQAVVGGAIGTAEPVADGEKQGITPSQRNDSSEFSDERPSEDVQAGVKKVEAVTLTWTRKELYFAYFWCVVTFNLDSSPTPISISTNWAIVYSWFSSLSLCSSKLNSASPTM